MSIMYWWYWNVVKLGNSCCKWGINFRNLLGILEGPVDLLLFSSFITDNTWSLLSGDIKNKLAYYGFFRYSEYLCFGLIKVSSIF